MTTILIVDDEYVIAQILGLALEDEGYNTLTVNSARKALEILDHERPDLVITDFMMPGMDGAEFAQHLRARPLLAQMPIILMTGGHAWQARDCKGLFSVVLDKPFDLSQMLTLVRTLIRS